jgi:hypothetical protein
VTGVIGRQVEAYTLQDKLRPREGIGYSTRYSSEGFVNVRGRDVPHGYTQVFKNGSIEAVKAGVLKGERNTRQYIHARLLPKTVLTRLPQYLEATRSMSITPPVIVIVSIQGVQGKSVIYQGAEAFMEEGVPLKHDTISMPEIVIDQFGSPEDVRKAMRPAFDALWNAAGAAHSTVFDENGRWIEAPDTA